MTKNGALKSDKYGLLTTPEIALVALVFLLSFIFSAAKLKKDTPLELVLEIVIFTSRNH